MRGGVGHAGGGVRHAALGRVARAPSARGPRAARRPQRLLPLRAALSRWPADAPTLRARTGKGAHGPAVPSVRDGAPRPPRPAGCSHRHLTAAVCVARARPAARPRARAGRARAQAVACASRQPQYELKPADLIVGRLEDVSMVALRALFMSDDAFDDDPDSGMQKESATQPVRDFWGNELGSTRRMVMDPDTMDGGSSGGDDSWLYGGSGGAADAAE